jgi:hypothetical protein
VKALKTWTDHWFVEVDKLNPDKGPAFMEKVKEYIADRWLVTPTQIKIPLEQTKHAGKLIVHVDEWIVRYPDGFFRSMSKEEFAVEFEADAG